jgi:hypothetical protein
VPAACCQQAESKKKEITMAFSENSMRQPPG